MPISKKIRGQFKICSRQKKSIRKLDNQKNNGQIIVSWSCKMHKKQMLDP